jgi:DNA polymerase delta subunit 1
MALVLQTVDVDYQTFRRRSAYNRTNQGMVPVVRVFGVQKNGESVCLFVHGFHPYLYIEAPEGYSLHNLNTTKTTIVEHLRRIKDQNPARRNEHNSDPLVLDVEIVERRNIMHYQQGRLKLIKVTTSTPDLVSALRNELSKGTMSIGVGSARRHRTFESDLLFPLRFMIDCGMQGCSWLTVKEGDYKVRPKKETHCKVSTRAHT